MLYTNRWIAWLFVGPALILIFFFLTYPTLLTIVRSFYGKGTQIFTSTLDYVGLTNWKFIFTSPTMLAAMRNNALWTIVLTSCIWFVTGDPLGSSPLREIRKIDHFYPGCHFYGRRIGHLEICLCLSPDQSIANWSDQWLNGCPRQRTGRLVD